MLLRDSERGVETLLLRRNSRLAFHGGAWVFPGGRIDAEDRDGLADEDEVGAARKAAVREAREEASLQLDADDLVLFARWTTPPGPPKRFRTWFFAARSPGGAVQVDGGEIHDHTWVSPDAALAAQRAGEIELPPPTFVTITELHGHSKTDAALAALAGEPRIHTPRMTRVPGGVSSLYEGDAGYDARDPDASGPRHRLWTLDTGWRYERSGGGGRSLSC